jgi:Tfp pilus assembly protein PilO
VNQHRKIILIGVFGALLLLWCGNSVMRSGRQGPFGARRQKITNLRSQIAKRQKEFAEFRQAGKQLAVWEEQSLPSDPEVARGLYQAWLLELARHVGLTGTNVDSSEPVNSKGLYYLLSFSMRGRGTLEQLTVFLYEFYGAGHLHQLRSMQVTPTPRGELLDLSFSIEAVALHGLERQDRLGRAPSTRLAFDNLAPYQSIVRRNVFAAGGPALDAASQTWLTAVTQVDGRPTAWFSLDGARRTLKAAEGESLELGACRAKVAEVCDNDVVLDIDGQRWLMTIGDSLGQAAALPPGL